jgi:hypothetical protein
LRRAVWLVPPILGSLLLALVLRSATRARAPAVTAAAPALPAPVAALPPEPPFNPSHPNSGLPADVDAVLAAKCRRCHTSPARNGAPFPLYTWDDTRGTHHGHPIHVRIGQVVQNGFMPILIPANPAVEPLTNDEKQTLLAWVAAGAPSASPSATSPPGSASRKPRGKRSADAGVSRAPTGRSSATPAPSGSGP